MDDLASRGAASQEPDPNQQRPAKRGGATARQFGCGDNV
jgi:hypothetical protein